jgi:2-polyprenyl-3-methyl-5-hydroxy-6-metoxy-1,4-benzoquinol methylase
MDPQIEVDETIREQYDRTFYLGAAKPLAHPIHLATLATLFGMNPPAPATSRVLELGCGTGTNLLAVALDLPGAALTGIDLSPAQIHFAQAQAARESLGNVELRVQSITDLTADAGCFDYIICHGVFSWVPEVVRQAILRICRENLSPQGVAYISYNAYPGRRGFEAVREMMLHHTSRISDAAQRVAEARAILEMAATSAPENSEFSAVFVEEARSLRSMPNWLVLHDYLAPINQSFYFTQFNELAREAGLQFLGESNPGTMLLSMLGPQVSTFVRSHARDLTDAEQYMDFFRNRRFRETLLCHAGIPLDRRFDPARVRRMFAASALRPREAEPALADYTPVIFELPGGHELKVSGPLNKAAMLVLIECYPKRMHFDELVHAARDRLCSHGVAEVPGDTDRLAGLLFDGFVANLVELRCA